MGQLGLRGAELLTEGGEGLGVEEVFGLLDAGVEGFGGVVREDRDLGLREDGAGVNSCIYQVDGAASDFDASLEGLPPSF